MEVRIEIDLKVVRRWWDEVTSLVEVRIEIYGRKDKSTEKGVTSLVEVRIEIDRCIK